MKNCRSKLSILATLWLFACSPSYGADAPSGPLPTDMPGTSLSGSISANSPYADLQEAWDDCFTIRSTCTELLDEGRYAPARQKWVDYFASTIEQALSNAKAAYEATKLPADVAASSASAWTATGSALDAMQAQLKDLKAIAASMKTPTDDKYPAAFWKPARDIMTSASDFDKSLVHVLGAMEQSGSAGVPQAVSSKLSGGVSFSAKSTDVEGLTNAAKKISDVTTHLFAELDRFNLSWGPAPKQPLQNEFYQGAFTKQEILSQYKYMPSFVFTTDPSVARFTYRLPPRKNVLAVYGRQIGKLLNLMDTDMLTLQSAVNSSGNQALAAPWQELEKKYIDARQQYLTFYNLLNATTDDKLSVDIRDDQTKFGTPIVKIRDDMEQFRDAMNDFVAIGK